MYVLFKQCQTRSRAQIYKVSAVYVPALDVRSIQGPPMVELSSKAHVRARQLTVLWKLTARYPFVEKTLDLSFNLSTLILQNGSSMGPSCRSQ